MSSKWTSPGLGRKSTPVEVPEDLKDELIVVLLYGKNMFGDKIYSYLELPLKNLPLLQEKLYAKAQFSPSEFGSVIHAGKGEPTDEVRAEIRANYPHSQSYPDPATIVASVAQPKVWGEE